MSSELIIAGMAAVGAGLFFGKESIADELTARSDSFTRWDSLFISAGRRYSVPPKWLKAIAMNESSLGEAPSVKRGLAAPTDTEGSKSSDGKSWGLMQLTLPTARDFVSYTTPADLNNPEFSVKVAAQFVAYLMRQIESVDLRYVEWVIKSYNQGLGNTRKERGGQIQGYAEEYWRRWQRNLALIEKKQGDLG